jgi:hypothetical protein
LVLSHLLTTEPLIKALTCKTLVVEVAHHF